MPKLIALDLAIKFNALTKFESETGKISKLSSFFILDSRSFNSKESWEGFIDEQNINLHFEVRQLLIKLKKASSHLSLPLMRLISSIQIRSKLSSESKSDVSRFKMSLRGIYKEVLFLFAYKLQSDCIR